MPCEVTYPFFPPGHLTPHQCWEIWTSYYAVCAEDVAVSERQPLAMQQRLWPFYLRGILHFWHRFGFTLVHLDDLLAFAARVEAESRARDAST